MILYAVKTTAGYLRDKKEDGVFVVTLAAASVYPDQQSAVKLKEKFKEGRIVELTLTERVL